MGKRMRGEGGKRDDNGKRSYSLGIMKKAEPLNTFGFGQRQVENSYGTKKELPVKRTGSPTSLPFREIILFYPKATIQLKFA